VSNDCFTTITIYGPVEDVVQFTAAVQPDERGILSILRTHLPLTPTDDVVGMWGVSGPDEAMDPWQGPETYDADGLWTAYLNTTSPWSVPVEGIRRISEQWPNMLFSCFGTEPANGFVQWAVVRGGGIIFEVISEYPLDCYADEDADDEEAEQDRASDAEHEFEADEDARMEAIVATEIPNL
jgi:hypothetical protein